MIKIFILIILSIIGFLVIYKNEKNKKIRTNDVKIFEKKLLTEKEKRAEFESKYREIWSKQVQFNYDEYRPKGIFQNNCPACGSWLKKSSSKTNGASYTMYIYTCPKCDYKFANDNICI